MTELARLAPQWTADTITFVSSDRLLILNEILSRHAERQRRYHGVSHLVALFDLLARHAPHISLGSAPRLAVWWHDAVYDPQARDNEEKSAVLAREHLAKLGASADLIEATANLIMMTKNHWVGPSAGDGDFFLDADIAILGAPPAIYDAYASGVRQEYAWAPDEAYRAGRSTFLNAATAKPRLFRTEVFETTYAEPARANMHRELASLS